MRDRSQEKVGEVIVDAQMATSRDIRTGYLSGPGLHEYPVEYAVVNGLAIHEGCIELGTVEAVEAEATRIRAERQESDENLHSSDADRPDPEPQMGIGLPQNSSFLWTNGVLAYTVNTDLPNPRRVDDAIAHIQDRSAIRFVRRTAQNAGSLPNYCEFVRNPNTNVSSSMIGMRGGQQFIRISDSATVGTVVHELLHALGIYHEQSRSDRDTFVEIKWENIIESAVSNFQTKPGSVDYHDYDYGSIMHYPGTAFSKNGQPTIVPRQSGVTIGQRNGLSYTDRQTIASLYERFFTKGYTGVWRAGTGGHALWVNAPWDSFQAKWQEWSQQGLRLQDIHVRQLGAQTLFSGVWLPGSGGYGLWANATWDSFQAKWQEWNQQGLRLVDLHIHRSGNENRYSGVWLAGTGGYGLWVNATWESFRAKWQEWGQQGLRLHDIHVQHVDGAPRFSGVWQAGTGGYALWANTTWDSFRAKWQELAAQNLRLADINLHRVGNETRYSGVWLPGSGGYALWANVTWESFRAKWEELAERGFRLVDFEMAMPEGGMAESDEAMAAFTAGMDYDRSEAEPFGGLFGIGEDTARTQPRAPAETAVGGMVAAMEGVGTEAEEGAGGFSLSTGTGTEITGDLTELGGAVLASSEGRGDGEAQGGVGGTRRSPQDLH